MVESFEICPCGIYREICPIYIADKGNHSRLKEILGSAFNVSANEVTCDGCLSEAPFVNCQKCAIKSCILDKGLKGCHLCEDFPCPNIETMDDITKRAILRAVPIWRKLGTEEFIEKELKHYQCPQCNNQLFMGAQKCRNCGNPVALD